MEKIDIALNLLPILEYLYQAGVTLIRSNRGAGIPMVQVDWNIFHECFPEVEPYRVGPFMRDYKITYNNVLILSTKFTTEEEFAEWQEEHPREEVSN